MLLALDPGTNSPGIALFHQNPTATLIVADRVSGADWAGYPDGERWLRVGRILATWAMYKLRVGPAFGYKFGDDLTVVFERPQWYARGKSKGDPNQLAGIAGVAANLTGILSCYFHPFQVVSPTPAEWIGQLPKTCPACKANKKKCPVCKGSAWNTPRGKRIRSRLSDAELALVPDQNDAIDACGIGLFALGRLTPKTVLSNGRDGR